MEQKVKQKAWLIYTEGIPAGHFFNLRKVSLCYLNGTEMVRIYQKGNHAFVERQYVQLQADGTVIASEKQVLDFGIYDQIRIYEDPSIARLGNSKDEYATYNFQSLSKFMKVSQRKEKDQRQKQDEKFFISYNYKEEQWTGRWGMPKKNFNLWIKQNGQLECSKKWSQLNL